MQTYNATRQRRRNVLRRCTRAPATRLHAVEAGAGYLVHQLAHRACPAQQRVKEAARQARGRMLRNDGDRGAPRRLVAVVFALRYPVPDAARLGQLAGKAEATARVSAPVQRTPRRRRARATHRVPTWSVMTTRRALSLLAAASAATPAQEQQCRSPQRGVSACTRARPRRRYAPASLAAFKSSATTYLCSATSSRPAETACAGVVCRRRERAAQAGCSTTRAHARRVCRRAGAHPASRARRPRRQRRRERTAAPRAPSKHSRRAWGRGQLRRAVRCVLPRAQGESESRRTRQDAEERRRV